MVNRIVHKLGQSIGTGGGYGDIRDDIRMT